MLRRKSSPEQAGDKEPPWATIEAELATKMDAGVLHDIVSYHAGVKSAARLQDWEKCLVQAGKMAEAVMRAIRFMRTGIVVDHISVESEIAEDQKAMILPESVRTLIPRSVRLVYDHRSKRGGAHGSFDPNQMDAAMVVSTCDWILGELVRVYFTGDPEVAMKVVKGITAKSMPLVESIDGDYVVLKRASSARQEASLILFSRYPERTTAAQLKRWMPNHSAANISTTLANMRAAKLVHSNSTGFVLTAFGLKATEEDVGSESVPTVGR